jgi:N-methylhydantoinase A
MSAAPRLLSIDVGGTFTDVLCVDAQGAIKSYKLPSVAPERFAGVLNEALGHPAAADELLYSTTVTLNGLLSGEFPRIGLVVTSGFRDILETARLPASAGEAPLSQLPRRLVALEWVREIGARLEPTGAERTPVDREQVEGIARGYVAAGVGVVAVALLHSYLNPQHEDAIATIFAEVAAEIEIVRSSAVLPELREYERTLAAALNACLIPVLSEHLKSLRHAAGNAPGRIWLMQSNGGLASAESVSHRPLTTALSGPGAAVVGMRWLGEQSGFANMVTLDVGGTSTDVALITDAKYALTTAGTVAGFPLKTPMVDVLSIGAGGGSIAREAADRRWHVGPESAGGLPGPACYGRGGTVPTLTDAQLVLGRIPDALLGGSLPLDRERAMSVLDAFGRGRGFDTMRTARGILEIASHNMYGAIRRVCVSRGHVPTTHALLAMGGAGPLHGAELAELLGMTSVVVPPQPGLAAAWGLLVADITRDFVRPLGIVYSSSQVKRLESTYADLVASANAWCVLEGIAIEALVITLKLDLRYVGMTHETTIECATGKDMARVVANTQEGFHDYFETLTGRSWRDHEAIEIVNMRLSAIGRRPRRQVPHLAASSARAPVRRTTRMVGFLGHADPIESAVIDRATLSRETSIAGPAIIEQYESTIVLPPAWRAAVDQIGNLILRPCGRSREA